MAYAAAPDATETSALAAIGGATSPQSALAPVPDSIADILREKRRLAAAAAGILAKQRHCLAIAIYFEARGEPARGQAAVAEVVLNRVASPHYPDTICDVVYQNEHRRNACQFSFACDGKPETISENKAWALAKQIAADVIAGRRRVTEVAGATSYHARYVSPYWAASMRRLARIGQHIFYQG